MPWTCGACAVDLPDDQSTCPACGATKESWTLHVDKTRALQISGSRAKLVALVGTSRDAVDGDDPANAEFETAPADHCPVIPKADLLALVEQGRRPAPAHRLVARVTPKKLDREVVLTIEFAADDVEEHEVDGEGRALSEQGAFDVQYVCVFGPEDVSGVSLPGIEVVDLTEETEEGYAPEVELAAVRKTVELPTRGVGPLGVQLLEVEDISFASGREVMLPGGWSHADDITGLAVVGAALQHARHSTGKRLLVAGHTDTVGKAGDNLVLSADRATNVYLYLSGQKQAWAAHCQEHHELEDLQAILKWIAWAHGWDTDPGPIDGKWGKGSSGARERFRQRYNQDFTGSLEPGSPQSEADWAAFFDLYDAELAERLKADVSKVDALRATLEFTDPPTLGCGESWPTQAPGKDNTHSAANRRVDVLFFEAGQVPALPGDPAGGSIYGEGGFAREYLDVDQTFKDPPDAPYAEPPFLEDCPVKPLHLVGAGVGDEAGAAAAESGEAFPG